jgi:ElaB/YqjD/DUF883 family membrane-anchored ribosome-binding protein
MADIRAQMSRVREAANDMAETTSTRIKDGADKAREGASDLIETGKDAYSDAKEKTQRAASRANEIITEHPVAAVAGAVIVGAVIAYAFPRSRRAMKAVPGLLTTALAARAAAADHAETVKAGAGKAYHAAIDGASEAASAARDVASSAKDSAVSADIAGKASRLADDILALVADKAEAVSDALKARLPKR